MATARKTVSLKLTQGAAHLLLLCASTPQLVTDPDVQWDVSLFRHDHLRVLPKPPEPTRNPAGEITKPVPDEVADAWSDAPVAEIPVGTEVFASLKALVKAAIGKGALASGSATLVLMRELELGRAKA